MKIRETVFTELADNLAEKGWALTDDFFVHDFLQQLLNEEILLFKSGQFKQAGIGKGSEHKVVSEIRSDYVHWLDEENLSNLQLQFWNQMQELKQFLNREFFLGLKEAEFHFAVYPEGSFYKKHLDRFQRDSGRTISCVLYLNQDWTDNDGGQLRIYNKETFTDVTPVFGRLVCFKSDEIEHEVLPTNKERYSITGWMKN
ncbi:MAG: 2OG-Fe(II) oxygenase [Bacteroidia bacterium]